MCNKFWHGKQQCFLFINYENANDTKTLIVYSWYYIMSILWYLILLIFFLPRILVFWVELTHIPPLFLISLSFTLSKIMCWVWGGREREPEEVFASLFLSVCTLLQNRRVPSCDCGRFSIPGKETSEVWVRRTAVDLLRTGDRPTDLPTKRLTHPRELQGQGPVQEPR